MVLTTEALTQSLRATTTPILGTYARLIALEAAAQRVHRLAHSARTAHAANSLEEAKQCLHALDHALDQTSDHVQHALIALDAELSR